MKGASVRYESSLERDFLHLLSFDPDLAQVIWQPFSVRWTDAATNKERTYTPDYLVAYDGPEPRTEMIEVKYRSDLWEQFWREGLKGRLLGARSLCRARGWAFRLMTEVEIRRLEARNFGFLRRYLHMDANPSLEERILAVLRGSGLSSPIALLAAAFPQEEERSAALPYVWRLVATGRVECDLAVPLTMSSPIAVKAEKVQK